MGNPCEQEPCKTAIADYEDAMKGAEAWQWVVQNLCSRLTQLRMMLTAAIMWLLILIALFVICIALFSVPIVCQGLLIALAVVTAVAAAIMSQILNVQGTLRVSQGICQQRQIELRMDYLLMRKQCPEECWLPEYTITCAC